MKKPLLNPILSLTLLLLILVLGACQATPAVTPTVTASDTPQASETSTPRPSDTATLTPEPTSTPTETATIPSPTPAVAFDQAKIIGVTEQVSSLQSGTSNVQIIVAFPGVTQAYNLTLDQKEYFCTLANGVPDRLFCNGMAKPKGDQELSLEFTDPESDEVLYSSTISIPSAYIPTAVPVGDQSTWCPDRGKNVSCEYECRITPGGSPCLVASCYDACGYYFSVNTCPADLKQPFTFCSEAVIAQMKAKYNIP
jgi:hypothetical protein